MARRFNLCILFAAALIVAFVGTATATPGQLDPTFGSAGTGLVRTDITLKGDTGYGEAIQSDDKVVVVGIAGSGGANPMFGVARYNANGTPDTTFSGDGRLATDFSPKVDQAISVAIQADGKIVVAGGSNMNGTNHNSRFALARYNTNGTLDTTFSGDGKVTTDLTARQDEVSGVAIQADGKIVAAGRANNYSNFGRFALARYNSNGTLDTSFSGDGKVMTGFPGGWNGGWSAGWGGVQIQADGKIVQGGDMVQSFSPYRSAFALARFNTDGTLDTSFSADGKVTADFTGGGDFISGLAIDGSGNIVAAGEANDTARDSRAALARYTSAGVLDTTFNGTGKVMTNYGPFRDGAYGVAIDGSGNIVTGGMVGGGGFNPRFAVSRYLSTGALDSTFGTGGKVFTDFGSKTDWADMVAIQSTGRIVAAGTAGQGSGNSKFALAGYEAS